MRIITARPLPLQVPRLSSMLRAALGSGGLPGAGSTGSRSSREAAPLQLPDLQQLLQQRGRLLEGRRRERADMQAGSWAGCMVQGACVGCMAQVGQLA